MKHYEKPEIAWIAIEATDILTASRPYPDEDKDDTVDLPKIPI